MTNLKTCLLFFLTGWMSLVAAQTPVEVLSAKGTDVSRPGSVIVKHVGNVKLRHQDVLLFCDQAIRNETTNRIDAYGHVLLVQGDSVIVKGDTLVYDGNERHATLRGRVIFQDHRTVLTTTQLDYYLPAGIAHYANRTRIADGGSVLNSRSGYYNVQTKQYTVQPDNRLASSAAAMLRQKPTRREVAIQLATATASNQNTRWNDLPTIGEGRYAGESGQLTNGPKNALSTQPQNTTPESVTTTVSAPVIVKPEALVSSEQIAAGNVVEETGGKEWRFNKPVVTLSATPTATNTMAIARKSERTALKSNEASKLTPSSPASRPVAVAVSKPTVASRKSAVVAVKPVTAEPEESDLEQELNRVRRSKSNLTSSAMASEKTMEAQLSRLMQPTRNR